MEAMDLVTTWLIRLPSSSSDGDMITSKFVMDTLMDLKLDYISMVFTYTQLENGKK